MTQNTMTPSETATRTQILTEASANLAIAECIAFAYEQGQWYNRSGERTTEREAGYVAFYTATVRYSDLTSAAMRQGWLDAEGYEDYSAAMLDDAEWQQRSGWMI